MHRFKLDGAEEDRVLCFKLWVVEPVSPWRAEKEDDRAAEEVRLGSLSALVLAFLSWLAYVVAAAKLYSSQEISRLWIWPHLVIGVRGTLSGEANLFNGPPGAIC